MAAALLGFSSASIAQNTYTDVDRNVYNFQKHFFVDVQGGAQYTLGEAKVVVTGYADAGTGNDIINDRLSAKRAATVAKILKEKYGIAESRISEESKGARIQPFADNDMNRVSILIAK